MNKVVRYTILPFWILAGIFVVTVAILIITPCAIYHAIRDAWLDAKDAKDAQRATGGEGADAASRAADACAADVPGVPHDPAPTGGDVAASTGAPAPSVTPQTGTGSGVVDSTTTTDDPPAAV